MAEGRRRLAAGLAGAQTVLAPACATASVRQVRADHNARAPDALRDGAGGACVCWRALKGAQPADGASLASEAPAERAKKQRWRQRRWPRQRAAAVAPVAELALGAV